MKKVLVLLLLFTAVFSAQTTIADIRQNDASGVSVLDGQTVTVSGIVTVASQFGTSGPAYIQDGGYGVAVYDNAFAGAVTIGDSVTVTAKVEKYNGLTELMNTSDLVVHGNGYAVEPTIITIDEIITQEWNGLEAYEALLIKVVDVEINSSGTFPSGSNINITDATGTMEMRVDNSVDYIGEPIPAGEIQMIGVIGQYDNQPPANSGYQLMPRYIQDFIVSAGPQIIPPVYATNVNDSSFVVNFKTVNPGNSEVLYGKTEGLELGSVMLTDLVTEHAVVIEGLEEFTKYYFMAASTNVDGTSESSMYNVTTTSSTVTTGAINVYFNGDVDNSIAIDGNEAVGNVNLSLKAIDRINSANYSIDLCLYSFADMSSIVTAILNAKNRGVKVRVVYDDRNMQNSMQQLINAGIKMSQRPAISGLMHNKFMIVDARDSNPGNDWIWTGSWNWTNTELSWKNNVIEINDPAIAEAYTIEFEEMWGSSTDDPSSAAARFGSFKSDNTNHFFEVAGRDIELYFSPSDQTESKIVNTIATADSSIYFSLLTFTSDPISNEIAARNTAGVDKIRGIISNVNDNGSEYNNMVAIAEDCFAYSGSGTLHNKYGLVDAGEWYSNPTVITGSHNWSNAANTRNDENALLIDDIYIANLYAQEFKALYNAHGGTGLFKIPSDTTITSVEDDEELLPNGMYLHQNYPNPFNPITSVKFEISEGSFVNLVVYNTLGQKVATILSRDLTAGEYVADFDASELSSGLYIYTISTQKGSISKKMMLLK